MLCNKRDPSETHLKLKSREHSFVDNVCLYDPIVWKFFTEHLSVTAVRCENFQNDWRTKTNFINARNLARFEFKMSF